MNGILGEEELEAPIAPDKPWYETLGKVSAGLLSVGSKIYTLETQKDIAEMKLQATALAQPSAAPSSLLQPTAVSVKPSPAGFPVLPIALGVGVLGIAYLLLSKKKGRR